jgi:hypothetical protein
VEVAVVVVVVLEVVIKQLNLLPNDFLEERKI